MCIRDSSKDDYSAYLYFTALVAGLPWPWIGGMSADEIATAAVARQEQIKELMRILAWIAYNLSLIHISYSVSGCFHSLLPTVHVLALPEKRRFGSARPV